MTVTVDELIALRPHDVVKFSNGGQAEVHCVCEVSNSISVFYKGYAEKYTYPYDGNGRSNKVATKMHDIVSITRRPRIRGGNMYRVVAESRINKNLHVHLEATEDDAVRKAQMLEQLGHDVLAITTSFTWTEGEGLDRMAKTP